MDFGFSREEKAFQREVRKFLKQELPPDWIGKVIYPIPIEGAWGDDELWAFCKDMARKLGKKGWLTINWPTEYGGLGQSHVVQLILCEELAYHEVPARDPIGAAMIGPLLFRYGTEEQKERHLKPIARGEAFWTEGFSEPSAGSDLFSIQTRATEDGNEFVINGQKVWTSGANRADWCFFLAKTDPEAPRRKSLSFFIADMRTPGITVKLLSNVVGEKSFNEVFFDEVRIPKASLIGEKGQGFDLAVALLDFERASIERVVGILRLRDVLLQYIRASKNGHEILGDPYWRRKLAEMDIEIEIGRLLSYWVASLQSHEAKVDREPSVAKLFCTECMQRVARVGMELLGLYSQLEPDSKWAPLGGRIEHWYLSTLGRTIGGGTSEIQRNTIAIRGLGLPRA